MEGTPCCWGRGERREGKDEWREGRQRKGGGRGGGEEGEGGRKGRGEEGEEGRRGGRRKGGREGIKDEEWREGH